MFLRCLLLVFCCSIFPQVTLRGQSELAAVPTVGLRDNRPRNYAFHHADVVVAPGQLIPNATVLVEGTTITAVGSEVDIPPGFMRIDCTGKRLYPGLVDAWSEVEVPSLESLPAYWNSNVTPERQAATVAAKPLDQSKKLRSQGITTRVLAPSGGIVKGSSCVVLLGDAGAGRALLRTKAWQHLQLTVPRESRERYPNSPMGAVALLRQSMYDAQWYQQAWNSYRARPELGRPETNEALDVLARSLSNDTFVVDAPNERMALRADNVAREFSLKMIIRGSGREYRVLDEIVATNRAILVPVNFPETPEVQSTEQARNTSLRTLMHWDLAPENPARLVEAGATICLTTDGMEDVDDFLKNVRTAVERGLDRDAALAAMTTTPARLLGIDQNVGRIRPGMLANLIMTDGDLFEAKTEVLECWVAGEQFVIKPPAETAADLVGRWLLTLRTGDADTALSLVLKEKDEALSGRLHVEDDDSEPVELKRLVRQRDRLTATIDLSEADASLPAGQSQLTLVTVSGPDAPAVFASITLPEGKTAALQIRSVAINDDDPETNDAPDGSSQDAEDEGDGDLDTDVAAPVVYPLGAYGLLQRITDQPTVMFRDATVWTCDESGKLDSADVLIRDGLIAAVGSNLPVPEGCQIIDARGKHITPGLIDCHSHMGTDGGVNESGQAVTAEVRIGDFIDNTDIQIYRQVAGGLTTSNILHGSANPIGGQNQVIKLRWGDSMDGLRMKEAPGGIKFALGENVKRNQSRYPNTRMGVEQIIRDQLLAAREYQARWRTWRQGDRETLPPRTDLQLEALAEVQRGERWIHCHSYRQDEIVATLDVLEEFGIQIGTLQHILEGYKVADRMVQHGAMGSAFSDWWAYKFEVFDAIPYNGAIMHERGVVVSFNSDDRELARHLNTEAAKATKYGGVPEEEALLFVTLNPAKQLRIDKYVGSIRVGKHADLVVWSGRPLSTLTRCEQTWIDGRRYFDLGMDRTLRERDESLRAQLIQKILVNSSSKKKSDGDEDEIEEEDRWVRRDVFCATHGALRHNTAGGN